MNESKFNKLVSALEYIVGIILDDDNPRYLLRQINAHASVNMNRVFMYLAHLGMESAIGPVAKDKDKNTYH